MRMAMVAVLAMGGAEEEKVWVFYSPDSPDATRIFRALRGRRVRPVLLVERYTGRRGPSAAFLASVRAAGSSRVFDPEGLRLAERFGIRRLPALAVRHGGRTHVACGAGLDVKEVLECGR